MPENPLAVSSIYRSIPHASQLKQLKKVQEMAEKEFVDGFQLAVMHAALGEKDQAFAALDKAFAQKSVNLYTMGVDPWMDPLRGDPRFARYLARLKLRR